MVNDKKDNEQWKLAKFWQFGKTRTIQPKLNIFQIFFRHVLAKSSSYAILKIVSYSMLQLLRLQNKLLRPLTPSPLKMMKIFQNLKIFLDLQQNFMSFLKIWRNLEIIFLPIFVKI